MPLSLQLPACVLIKKNQTAIYKFITYLWISICIGKRSPLSESRTLSTSPKETVPLQKPSEWVIQTVLETEAISSEKHRELSP